MHPHLEMSRTGQPVPFLGFCLFMGMAMSITAIPILGRLMMELGITQTRIGTVTISAAAVDDACGWILLATISSIVQAQFRIWMTLGMVALTVGFFLLVLFVVRPLLEAFHRGGPSKKATATWASISWRCSTACCSSARWPPA